MNYKFKRGDTVPLYFYLYSEKLIIQRGKSAGTVSLTTLEPHGITSPQTCSVRMYDKDLEYDTANVATASTPTTRTLTYVLGSGTAGTVTGQLGILQVPVDITGDTVFFYIKSLPTDSDTDKILGKSWSSHVDPTNGITSVELSTSDTNLATGIYYYELQRVTSGNKVYSSETGTITVEQDIVTAVS